MIWFLIGIIIFTYALNKITLKYGFKNLFYSIEIPKHIVEIDEDINITSILENKKPLSISYLRVEENFPKDFSVESYEYTTYVFPYQRVKRTYKVMGQQRGLFRMKDSTLALGDFIGFKTIYKNLQTGNEIVVLPRKLDLNEAIMPFGSLNGSVSVKRWIIDDPLMTIGVKEYTGNEPEKHIHWPSSLRHGHLMVRNFDFTTDNSVIIMLNIESTKPYWYNADRDSIEKSISIVRGIMEEMEDKKMPYSLTTNSYETGTIKDQFYYPGVGENQLNYFLEILGRINYTISSTFEGFLEGFIRRRGNYSTCIVVTPKIYPEYIEYLNNLTKLCARVVVISVHSDNMEKLNKNIIGYVGR